MTVTVQPITPNFAAEVGDVTLGGPLAAEDLAAIRAAFPQYAVLVFPDQEFEDESQLAFARHFGPLETTVFKARKDHKLRLHENMADVGNLDAENRILSADDRQRLYNLGNRLWHTDASYMPVPVVLGMLFAVAVPPSSPFGAGETEFADMRAAYDALSDEQREVVDPLVAEHDVFWSRAQIGFTAFPPGEREKYPPSRQRLVRRHPGSGRKCLYLSAHASHIVGWPVPEGRLLLHDLSDFATQPQFVYSHKWQVGDLVIWDNRDTMHRGRAHDENQPRDLRRATTLDIGSTLDEAA